MHPVLKALVMLHITFKITLANGNSSQPVNHRVQYVLIYIIEPIKGLIKSHLMSHHPALLA